MAKSYDFRIVIRKAELSPGFATVVYNNTSVFHETCVEMTLKDAIAERKRLSELEKRPHAAFLTMKYRDERKAPGINNVETLYSK